jgi:hypothetical protein
MYSKPIPNVGEIKKYSNKKHKHPRSGQMCKVLIASYYNAGVHNCLVQFSDGYVMVTSKWNLF